MAIRTKTELLNLFADNNSRQITAERLRDFVDSNLAIDFENASSSPYTVGDTADVVVADPGASVLNLPPIADFKDRGLTILNRSGGQITVVADSSETIELLPSVSLENLQNIAILTQVAQTNWDIISTNRSLFTFLRDTPNFYIGSAGRIVVVNNAEDGLEFIVNPSTQTANFFEEDNALATTIVDLVTFEDLNINLAANSLNTLTDFSVSGNTITKTTTGTTVFSIWWSMDGAPVTGNNRMYSLKVFKNGSTALDGHVTLTASANRDQAGSMVTLVSLTQNDTLDFKVRADSDIVDFDCVNNSVMIKRAD